MLISRRETGFTLIEIMVVLVIIAILAALIAPQILGRVDEARVTAAKQDIQTIGTALDFYKMDNFRYPNTDQGLEALIKKPDDPAVRNWRSDGYLRSKSVPKDPWGNDYRYLEPGSHGAGYDLYSLGSDGETGGEDADADIGSWNLSDFLKIAAMRVARFGRPQRGMTLIEILVVVLIIGILATIATLSVGLLGEDREIERESERMSNAIALLQEQAQLEGRDYGILLETTRYEFLRFDAFEQRWTSVEGDTALMPRQLPPDLGFDLVIEGRSILLRHKPKPEARLPQLVAWGSGEMSPYRLSLTRKGGGRVTLVGGLDGTIEIERGDARP